MKQSICPQFLAMLISVVFLLTTACSDDSAPGVSDPGQSSKITPSRAVATVTPEKSAAGESAKVSCELRDKDGEALDTQEFEVLVEPADKVNVAGIEISSKQVGEYKVMCQFKDSPDVAKEPATWTVVAATPKELELTFSPDKPGYLAKEKVTVKGVGTDEYGNSSDVEVTDVDVTPSKDVLVEGTDIYFSLPGTYTVTAASADDESVKGTAEVVVDTDAPIITVNNPARGLTSKQMEPVKVDGTVKDALFSVAEFKHNGTDKPFDKETGAFTSEWDLSYGINLLELWAKDDVGNEGSTWRSALWSNKYYKLTPPKMETDGVKDGVVIIFNKNGIDDGNHDPSDINDLATLFEVVLNNIDIMALIPSPLGKLLCEWHMQELKYKDASVKLTPKNGMLMFDISLNEFSIKVANKGSFGCLINDKNWGPLNMDAAKLLVSAEVSFDGADTQLKISDISFENLWKDKIPDIFEPFVDGVVSLFFNVMKELLQDLIKDLFNDIFEQLAIEEEVDLPSLSDDAEGNKLVLKMKPQDIKVTPDAMAIHMVSMASALKPKRPYEVLGSVGYAGCGDTTPLPDVPAMPLTLGLHEDFLNQLMFGVWDGGTLNTKVGEAALGDTDLTSLGVEDLDVTLDGHLPLVFNGCKGSPTIQIGDLYVDAKLKLAGAPSQMAFWVQGSVPVELKVVDGAEGKELSFDFSDFSDLRIEIAKNVGLFEGNDDGLLMIIKDQLLPTMLGSLTGGLGSFPLPEIDLSEMADGIPPGTAFALDIQKVSNTGGYIRLDGELGGAKKKIEPPTEPK